MDPDRRRPDDGADRRTIPAVPGATGSGQHAASRPPDQRGTGTVAGGGVALFRYHTASLVVNGFRSCSLMKGVYEPPPPPLHTHAPTVTYHFQVLSVR